MNLLDLILLLILAVSIWAGIAKGFVLGAADLIAWGGSLLLCVLIYPFVSTLISENVSGGWVLPLAFVITFIIVRVFLSFMMNGLLARIPLQYKFSPVNKYMGFLPGMINGLIYVLLVTIMLVLFPFGEGIKRSAQQSWIAERASIPAEQMQTTLGPIFDKIAKGSAGSLMIKPGAEKFINLDFKVEKPERRTDLEAEMLILINQERKKEGLTPLKADPEIAQVARAHSIDMFVRGYFSHFTPEKKSPFDRIRAAKVSFITAGENLALAPTLAIAHTGLMESPGHRANILHKSFGRVGIGIVEGGSHGLMITQNFRN